MERLNKHESKRRYGGVDPGNLQTAGTVRVLGRRHARAAQCFQSAAAALALLERGGRVFGLTKGQFSMIDLASAALERVGKGADVSVWTWCIAEYEVQAVTGFIVSEKIGRFRMVLDWTGAQRDMPLIADLQQRFGVDCLRVTKTHAKIVTVAGDGWQIVIRGSMNLNENPRFEQFDVSDGSDELGLVEGLMAEIWERGPALPVQQLKHSDAVAAYNSPNEAAKAAASPAPSWAPNSRDWFKRP